MITSIVPLPNFFNQLVTPDGKGQVLSGLMSCFTGDNEVYLPMNVELSQSRNLYLNQRFFKYKIRIVPDPHQVLQAYVIVISRIPLDFSNGVYGSRGLCTEIYPVYAVMYNPMMAPGYQTRVVFSCNAVNRFFAQTNIVCSPVGTREVESTYQYVWSIMHALDGNAWDDSILRGYTYLQREHNFAEIIGSLCGADGNYNQMDAVYLQKYAIRATDIPGEIVQILDAQLSTQLQMFMNPYTMNMDDVSVATIAAQSSWDTIGQSLIAENKLFTQSTDNILPCEPEDVSKMGTAVSEIFKVPHEDFWFDINTDYRNVTDKYLTSVNMLTGFKRSTSMFKHGDDLSLSITYACDLLGKFRDTDLKMHRSCMEDVAIYDRNSNQLLLYIDMVWWTLIAAPGLVNSGNSASF